MISSQRPSPLDHEAGLVRKKIIQKKKALLKVLASVDTLLIFFGYLTMIYITRLHDVE